MTTTKPIDISKYLVWEAYKRVKADGGAAGVIFPGNPGTGGADGVRASVMPASASVKIRTICSSVNRFFKGSSFEKP